MVQNKGGIIPPGPIKSGRSSRKKSKKRARSPGADKDGTSDKRSKTNGSNSATTKPPEKSAGNATTVKRFHVVLCWFYN